METPVSQTRRRGGGGDGGSESASVSASGSASRSSGGGRRGRGGRVSAWAEARREAARAPEWRPPRSAAARPLPARCTAGVAAALGVDWDDPAAAVVLAARRRAGGQLLTAPFLDPGADLATLLRPGARSDTEADAAEAARVRLALRAPPHAAASAWLPAGAPSPPTALWDGLERLLCDAAADRAPSRHAGRALRAEVAALPSWPAAAAEAARAGVPVPALLVNMMPEIADRGAMAPVVVGLVAALQLVAAERARAHPTPGR